MATLDVNVYKTKLFDVTISVLSKLSTNKHSFCWIYFGQLVINIDGRKRIELGDQVFCDACLTREKEKDCDVLFSKALVKAYSRNIATSNLLRHLKDEHNLEDTHTKKVANIKDFFPYRENRNQ